MARGKHAQLPIPIPPSYVAQQTNPARQTPEDIKNKKLAKKERKAAKAAAKANGEPKPSKGKKGFAPIGHGHNHEHGHVEEIAEDEQPQQQQQQPLAADPAPQPTGSEAAPAAQGDLTQRVPRATVEEAEDE